MNDSIIFFDENNQNGGIVISAGMSAFGGEVDDKAFMRVFRRVDQAMYHRKQVLKSCQNGKPIIVKSKTKFSKSFFAIL